MAGHQIDAADRRVMRHETFAAPEGHVVWIDEIDDVLELARPYGRHTARHLPELKTPAVST